MDETTHDGLRAVIETAERASGPQTIADGVFAVVVPERHRVEVLNTSEYNAHPRRKVARVGFRRVASFCEYFTKHALRIEAAEATGGDGTIWADIELRQVAAVLNDHPAGGPGWRDHRAMLALRDSPAWRDWTALDGKPMSQLAFAEHVEDHLPDISEPAGADLLELALSFHATKRASFSSDRRLKSGQVQLSYVEEIEAAAGRKQTMEVPDSFTLTIPIFDGDTPVSILARLRYRVDEGSSRSGSSSIAPRMPSGRRSSGSSPRLRRPRRRRSGSERPSA